MPTECAVMESPELFEQILLALPMRSLLITAPLVCKRWRDTIASSPAIQQALFFRPIASKTWTAEAAGDYIVNPLLEKLFPPFFRNGWSFETARGEDRHDKSDFAEVTGWHEMALSEDRDAFLRSGATWRRMLTQQPPAPAMGLFGAHQTADRHPIWDWHRRWHRPKPSEAGLRMGTLYDTIWQDLELGDVRVCGIIWAQDDLQNPEPVVSRESEIRVSSLLQKITPRAEGEWQIWDRVRGMLRKSSVIILARDGSAPMRPPRKPRRNWTRYRSEDFKRVDFTRDEDEPDEQPQIPPYGPP
jgi:hypothetical protein